MFGLGLLVFKLDGLVCYVVILLYDVGWCFVLVICGLCIVNSVEVWFFFDFTVDFAGN